MTKCSKKVYESLCKGECPYDATPVYYKHMPLVFFSLFFNLNFCAS